jgi:hypothetical protein
MNSYHGKSGLLFSLAHRCSDQIIKELCKVSGGTVFWYSLPKRGKDSQHVLRTKIAKLCLSVFFDDHLMKAMVQSIFDHNGRVTLQGQSLYYWLLHHVYHGNVSELYADWLLVKPTVHPFLSSLPQGYSNNDNNTPVSVR